MRYKTANWWLGKFNHTMIRVKDPKKSIAFYELIGMTVVKEMPMKEMGFTNYFMGWSEIP